MVDKAKLTDLIRRFDRQKDQITQNELNIKNNFATRVALEELRDERKSNEDFLRNMIDGMMAKHAIALTRIEKLEAVIFGKMKPVEELVKVLLNKTKSEINIIAEDVAKIAS